MDDRRVVDITVVETGKFGSGYLLSDRLILTAGHVLDEASTKAECQIRPLDNWQDVRRGTRYEWTAPQGCDAALIELDADQSFPEIRGHPIYGRPVPGAFRKYNCKAIGFPKARKINQLREEYRAEGVLQPGIRANMFTATIADPPELDSWPGFSGASVFNGDLLVGIVESTLTSFGGRELRITPIQRLLDDAEFRTAVFGKGDPVDSHLHDMRPSDYLECLQKLLRANYCFINRESQCERIEGLLAEDAPIPPILVAGFNEDGHRYFVERLVREGAVQRLIGDMPVDRAARKISWPSLPTLNNIDDELRDLRKSLAEIVGGPDATDPATALESRERPVLAWTRLELSKTGPGHGELLSRWIDYCVELTAKSRKLLCLVCVVANDKPAKSLSGLDRIFGGSERSAEEAIVDVLEKRANAGSVIPLQRLSPVGTGEDVNDWLERIERWPFGGFRLTPDLREEIRSRIDEKLTTAEAGDEMLLLPLTRFLNGALGA